MRREASKHLFLSQVLSININMIHRNDLLVLSRTYLATSEIPFLERNAKKEKIVSFPIYSPCRRLKPCGALFYPCMAFLYSVTFLYMFVCINVTLVILQVCHCYHWLVYVPCCQKTSQIFIQIWIIIKLLAGNRYTNFIMLLLQRSCNIAIITHRKANV